MMVFQRNSVSLLLPTLALALNLHYAAATTEKPGFMDMVTQKLEEASGNLRRSLSAPGAGDVDICDLFHLHLGNPFRLHRPRGDCKCEGTLAETTTLECAFDHVCDSDLCAQIQINASLSHIIDPNSPNPFGLGVDPEMKVSACVDTDLDELEEMCLDLDFAKPHFFWPKECSFSYGEQECVCVMDHNDNGIPCYAFDCSKVVPQDLAAVVVANTCKAIDLSSPISGNQGNMIDVVSAILSSGAMGGASSQTKDPLTVFIPALSDLPGETVPHSVPEGMTAMDMEFMEQVVVAEEEDEKVKDGN